MKILVIGEPVHFQECSQKLGTHDYTFRASPEEADLVSHEVVFDFRLQPSAESLTGYAQTPVALFLNTCTFTLASLAQTTDITLQCTPFGFNGLPTLFNREFLEVTLLKRRDAGLLESICKKLNTAYLVVDDRVGLVTPRVICMIINEAYYTVQEGTASRDDIDLAMKLGTNYPYGPFEWCEKIGLQNVYSVLEAVYEDTKDERYKIAPLLKKEYLLARS